MWVTHAQLHFRVLLFCFVGEANFSECIFNMFGLIYLGLVVVRLNNYRSRALRHHYVFSRMCS